MSDKGLIPPRVARNGSEVGGQKERLHGFAASRASLPSLPVLVMIPHVQADDHSTSPGFANHRDLASPMQAATHIGCAFAATLFSVASSQMDANHSKMVSHWVAAGSWLCNTTHLCLDLCPGPAPVLGGAFGD